MTSVTGAVVGCYFVTVIYETFRRWRSTGSTMSDRRPARPPRSMPARPG
jgi:hypothetical protein